MAIETQCRALEIVRAHQFGSLVSKPTAGSPSGRQMAPRCTASVTTRNRPHRCCWCNSTLRPSSARRYAALGRGAPEHDPVESQLDVLELADLDQLVRVHPQTYAVRCETFGSCGAGMETAINEGDQPFPRDDKPQIDHFRIGY